MTKVWYTIGELYDVIRKLVLVAPTSMFYKLHIAPIISLKPLKTDEDMSAFVQACYEHNFHIDLDIQHNDYDIEEMIKEEVQS